MEDLWEKTKDLDCDACCGINDRCCGGIVGHYPRHVYRILGLLENFEMPEDDLLNFVQFIDERGLLLEVGHWTSCYECGWLRINLKDYTIDHRRSQNLSTLKVWQWRSDVEIELVYSASWMSLSFKPGTDSMFSEYEFE